MFLEDLRIQDLNHCLLFKWIWSVSCLNQALPVRQRNRVASSITCRWSRLAIRAAWTKESNRRWRTYFLSSKWHSWWSSSLPLILTRRFLRSSDSLTLKILTWSQWRTTSTTTASRAKPRLETKNEGRVSPRLFWTSTTSSASKWFWKISEISKIQRIDTKNNV